MFAVYRPSFDSAALTPRGCAQESGVQGPGLSVALRASFPKTKPLRLWRRLLELWTLDSGLWTALSIYVLTFVDASCILPLAHPCGGPLSRVVEGSGPRTPQQPGGDRPGANSCP